jgi:mRNA interferase MazF
MKDFDRWNSHKKQIQSEGTNKFYHPRDIWWCYLGVNVGFEQDGTGKEYQRPVLILKGFSKHVCLAIPLTTSQKKNPYHLPIGVIDGKSAFVIISQLKLVDTKRLINKIDMLPENTFQTIKKAVKDLL